jgi:pyruvate dehydrogenase E2 component (dihydrolipoamide acetyltransferase)
MPHEIRVPRLGWSMEEGTFVRWLKSPGERVQPGEALFELEGDKAIQEIEAVDGGILHVGPEAPRPGDDVAVGVLLGYLLADDEPAPQAAAESAPPYHPAPSTPAPFTARAGTTSPQRAGGPVATPRARRVAWELGIDWTKLNGSGRGGRIREADVLGAADGATPE